MSWLIQQPLSVRVFGDLNPQNFWFRKIFRALRPKAISLMQHSSCNPKRADHRFWLLFGDHQFDGHFPVFWKIRLGRMYHKDFRYFTSLVYKKFLILRDFLVRRNASPPRLPPRRGVIDPVTKGSEPVEVAAAVKGPPPLPWQANLPFSGVERLPAEEPWWANGGLPKTKLAFVEHFYSYQSGAGALHVPESYPGDGRVTILLDNSDLQSIMAYCQVLDVPYPETLVGPQVLWLDDPFSKVLFKTSRVHICTHPHDSCDRSSVKEFVYKNPWSIFDQAFKECGQVLSRSLLLGDDPAYSAGANLVEEDEPQLPPPPLPPRRGG